MAAGYVLHVTLNALLMHGDHDGPRESQSRAAQTVMSFWLDRFERLKVSLTFDRDICNDIVNRSLCSYSQPQKLSNRRSTGKT